MKLQELLRPEIQALIFENLEVDTDRLLLNASKFPEIPMPEVVNQIKLRQKAKSKLPTWTETPNLIFSTSISYEQASSEMTAKFKASLFSGQTFVDLTGGFGVDAYFLSQNFTRGFHIERQAELHQIVKHNYQVLNHSKINCHHSEADAFLNQLPEILPENTTQLDLIFIDPARRDLQNKKVFRLADCEPNVIELLPKLLKYSKNILVKTSPMSDISLVTKELRNVQKVWVVAVENECKEVLFWINSEKQPENLLISAVNLTKNEKQIFDFKQLDELNMKIGFALPSEYLYRPNTAILKAGAFKTIVQKFQLKKLHPNTHLYTASEIRADFTGKIYRILQVCKYSKKEVLKYLPNKKANITTANFPDSPTQMRKKLGLKDDGSTYLFGVTDRENKKVILITELIRS